MGKVLKYITPIIVLIFTLIFFTGNEKDINIQEETKGAKIEKPIYENISVNKTYEMLKDNPDIILIDVRTKEEFEEEKIKYAIHLNEFQNLDRNKIYILYCKRSTRSENALNKMKEQNFQEVYNMIGGIDAWKQEGFETIK